MREPLIISDSFGTQLAKMGLTQMLHVIGLIPDDLRPTIASRLEAKGLTFRLTNRLAEALELLEQYKPKLVLTVLSEQGRELLCAAHRCSDARLVALA